jgi:hypothetical protein
MTGSFRVAMAVERQSRDDTVRRLFTGIPVRVPCSRRLHRQARVADSIIEAGWCSSARES